MVAHQRRTHRQSVDGSPEEEQCRPADHREAGERQGEADPGEEDDVGLDGLAQTAGRGARHEAVEPGAEEAEGEPGDRGQGGGGQEGPRRPVDGLPERTSEGPVEEPGAVAEGQDRRSHRQGRRGRREPRRAVGLEEGHERLLLAHETEEGRETRHRQGGEPRHGRRQWHGPTEPGELPDVPAARLVVDDAGDHEQGRLVGRVGQDQQHRRDHGLLGAQAEQGHDEPELADGGVGQQGFEVVLLQGEGGAHDGGDEPGQHHGVQEGRLLGEQRGQPGHEVEARLHHRGGVEIGADRCGGDHRSGEPELEGHLGRLREGPEEHEGEDRPEERMPTDHVALHQEFRDGRAPPGDGEEDEAGEQRETPQGGDEEGPQRRASALGGPLAGDEEEGGDARQLPEDEEEDDVAGQDEPEHGRREERDQAVGPSGGGIPAEVAGRVGHHERPHTEDEEREEERQPVEDEGEPDPHGREPGGRHGEGLALHDARGEARHGEGGEAVGEGQRVAGGPPHATGEGGSDGGEDDHPAEGGWEHERGAHRLSSLRPPGPVRGTRTPPRRRTEDLPMSTPGSTIHLPGSAEPARGVYRVGT